MIQSTKDSATVQKLKTSNDKWPEEFPEVQLVPGLTGHLRPRTKLTGSDIDEDDDEVIPGTEGHVHSFDYEFKNEGHGYLHVWVCDLDGPPLTEAVCAFQELASELNEMIEQLINLPAGNYPYPPKGWDEAAIAKSYEDWLEDSRKHSRNGRSICNGIRTEERPMDYAVDEKLRAIDETRGHINQVCLDMPEIGLSYHRVAFDDRNGPIEDQTADHLQGMIQALEAKLAEVEAARVPITSR